MAEQHEESRSSDLEISGHDAETEYEITVDAQHAEAQPARKTMVPPIEEHTRWLREMSNHVTFFTPDDDLGTTFLSCGVVLLVMALAGTQHSTTIAEITCLPEGFVKQVVQSISAIAFRKSKGFANLRHTLETNGRDFPDVIDSLHSALERLWMQSDLFDQEVELLMLRDGYLVGGSRQTWRDPESGWAGL